MRRGILLYTSNYCITAGLSILFLIGCLIHLRENDVFSLETIGKFKRLLYTLISEIILDCLFVLLEGRAVETAFLYVVKFAELSLNSILLLLVFDIFYDAKKGRHGQNNRDRIMANIHGIIILLNVATICLLALALFDWNVFTIDANNHYRRGPLMLIYLAILSFGLIALIWGMTIFSEKTQSSIKATLYFFAGALIVGMVLRDIFPKTNYDFLCMSVSMPFLLVYYSHITLRLDPLTKLLNRQVYMRLIERVNYDTIAIAIDANNFKHINDTYGHRCGDETLKQFATIIRKTFGKYAYCFRIGGDEFYVILKPGVFDDLINETPDLDAYVLAKSLTEKLDTAIAELQNDNTQRVHLEYGVSQGAGVYYSSETHYTISLEERKTFKEVIEITDKNMYKAKHAFKKSLINQ